MKTFKTHLNEKIEGLVKKSKQTGVPYGILKKVLIEEWQHGKVGIDLALVNNNGHLQE